MTALTGRHFFHGFLSRFVETNWGLTMKRVLFAAVVLLSLAGLLAAAADLPTKAPILKAPPIEVWNWTGFYIGGNVGYSWGRSDTDVNFFNPTTGLSITPPAGSITSAKFDMNGVVGGGQAGY